VEKEALYSAIRTSTHKSFFASLIEEVFKISVIKNLPAHFTLHFAFQPYVFEVDLACSMNEQISLPTVC
jgi:hypothetical protein